MAVGEAGDIDVTDQPRYLKTFVNYILDPLNSNLWNRKIKNFKHMRLLNKFLRLLKKLRFL